MTHRVYRQDHLGQGVLVAEPATLDEAMEQAREGKATAKPSRLTANIWYVASRRPDGSGMWECTFV